MRDLLDNKSSAMLELLDDQLDEVLLPLVNRKVHGDDEFVCPALYAAVRSGDSNIVNELLKLGADVCYEASAATYDASLGHLVEVRVRLAHNVAKAHAAGSKLKTGPAAPPSAPATDKLNAFAGKEASQSFRRLPLGTPPASGRSCPRSSLVAASSCPPSSYRCSMAAGLASANGV